MAQQQLEDSIDLFLRGRFVSALALAGAAEELMKQLLRARNIESAIDADIARVHRIRAHLGSSPVTDSYIYKITYEGRNHIKHHYPGQPETGAFDPFGEAFKMLQLATDNAARLKLRVRNMKAWLAWFHETFGAQQDAQADDPTSSTPAA